MKSAPVSSSAKHKWFEVWPGVATASPAVTKGYDVALNRPGVPAGMTQRVSYVIDRSGRIAYVHADMDYREHVSGTLAAIKALRAKRPG